MDDTYPTNQDLRVHFSLTPTVTPASGDRIGLYRMTNVAPSNAVCFLEVGLPDSHAGGEAEMQMQQPVRREIVFSGWFCPFFYLHF